MNKNARRADADYPRLEKTARLVAHAKLGKTRQYSAKTRPYTRDAGPNSECQLLPLVPEAASVDVHQSSDFTFLLYVTFQKVNKTNTLTTYTHHFLH